MQVIASKWFKISLVEHSLGVRGVGSSNLPVPTIYAPPKISQALQFRVRTRAVFTQTIRVNSGLQLADNAIHLIDFPDLVDKATAFR
jgi:hypothetical protein